MMINRMRELHTRWRGVPLVVVQDAKTGRQRCINGLHVQTFVPSPFDEHGKQGKQRGTIITFASGDTVTVTDEFDELFELLSGFVVDG
jgi:hypothetical protein